MLSPSKLHLKSSVTLILTIASDSFYSGFGKVAAKMLATLFELSQFEKVACFSYFR